MQNLIVPNGTSAQRLVQVQITTLDNGVILNRVWVVQEAGKPPYQAASALFFESLKKALDELQKDV